MSENSPILVREAKGSDQHEEEEFKGESEHADEPKEQTDGPAVSKEAEEKEPPPSPPVVEQSFEEGSSSGQRVYNEYALRVAYIMRSYLSVRQAPDQNQPPLPPVRDRCRAMMEVVRKQHGKWAVSKLMVEHNHEFAPTRGGAVLAPAMGMEFESVDAAKQFYYEYGEKLGFKARTGSNRRSSGGGALIMQRFLCWKGNYLMYKQNLDASIRKRKRGPYKKKAHWISNQVVAAAVAKKNEDVGDAVQVEGLPVKVAAAKEDQGVDFQRDTPLEEAEVIEKEFEPKASASAVRSIEAKATTTVPTTVGRAGGNITIMASTSQSRLLRELGVRVSRYTDDERREIISKYMLKRTNRQMVERTPKVPSRQAWAERRQRGIGGRFLSRDELQAPSGQEEATSGEPETLTEDPTNLGGGPNVEMVFLTEDKAYEFYVKYAGTIGFSVRKGWWDKTARNVTRSRVYVCSREGFRPKNITPEASKPQPETRIGCPARMAIKIMPDGKYRVNEFVPEHNHQLAAPLDLQMLKSQRLLAKAHLGGHPESIVIPADYKNYLRSKRKKNMQTGDAGALLEYLQKMKGDNPSFFYAIQLDQDDQLTNIFWADPKSLLDYHYFGDVVCFDTSYQINEYGRPLTLFLGVNHHKQLIIFGAALLYDESVQSFKWLFETFKSAMNEKHPKTIFTDQQTAIVDAVAAVWPGTNHRLCIWHVYQNAKRLLSDVFEGSETFTYDFARCLYDYDEEEEFLSAWETMLEKYDLRDNEWLRKLYQEKQNWALVYGHHIFFADMPNLLRNENLHCILRDHLKPEINLLSFFNEYEKLLGERRYAEQLADYHANQGTSRIPHLQFLWQAANAYTPAVFDMFRSEFEFFMNCMVSACGEVGTIAEYEINVKDKVKAHLVTYDSSESIVLCSCKKFEFVGIPCCHVLKVLDLRNIKEVPSYYILKRWGKDAKEGSIRENYGFAPNVDPKLSLRKRHSSLCRVLYKIAARAAENVEAYSLMESQSDQLLEQVETILRARLIEKSASSTSKAQQQNLIRNGSNNGECQRLSGKKKKKNGDSLHRHQNGLDSNKRHKGRQGPPHEAEASLRGDELPESNNISGHSVNASQFYAPNQFVQGSCISGHQFGLGGVQGFHSITQFSQMQESSATALPQQPFHGSTQLSQASSAPDVNSLQFVAGNPQLEHQSTDQGHYTIPVWDFL